MYFTKEIKRNNFTISQRTIDRTQEMIINLCAIQNVKIASTQVLPLSVHLLFYLL